MSAAYEEVHDEQKDEGEKDRQTTVTIAEPENPRPSFAFKIQEPTKLDDPTPLGRKKPFLGFRAPPLGQFLKNWAHRLKFSILLMVVACSVGGGTMVFRLTFWHWTVIDPAALRSQITKYASKAVTNVGMSSVAFMLPSMSFGIKIFRPWMWAVLAGVNPTFIAVWSVVNTMILSDTLALGTIYLWCTGAFLLASVLISKTTNQPHVWVLFFGSQLPVIIVLVLYDMFLFPWWAAAGGLERAAIRIGVHPVAFFVVQQISRFTALRIQGCAPERKVVFCMAPMVVSSMMGHLLVYSVGTLSGSLVTALVASLLEIVMRLSLPIRDNFMGRLINFRRISKGLTRQMSIKKKTTIDDPSLEVEKRDHLSVFYETFTTLKDWAETSAIVVIGVQVIVYSVLVGKSADIPNIVVMMLIQLVFELGVDMVVSYGAEGLGRSLFAIARQYPRKHGIILLVFTTFVSACFVSNRGYSLLQQQGYLYQ